MSLKKFLLETENSSRRSLLLWIVFAVVLGIMAWDGIGNGLKDDGPELVLETAATLSQKFDGETLTTRMAAGERIKVLGINRSSFGQQWLVRTMRGEVGWVDASDLTGVRQVVADGNDKGDTVSVQAIRSNSSNYISKYTYINKGGEEKKRSTKDFIPALDGWDDFAYNKDAIGGVCTQAKFEKKVIGKSLEQIEEAYGDPELLRVVPGGLRTRFFWKTFDPATGQMWRPDVVFGKDSIATDVTYGKMTDRASGWLRNMPLASVIIDFPLTSVLIRGSRYDAFANPMIGPVAKAFTYCLLPIVLLCLFLWFFATSSIPVLIMGWLVAFPASFGKLSDWWLRALMFFVMLASCYVWSVMLLAWGMFPIFVLVVFIVGWYSFSLASSPLCMLPHCRCPKCHYMYTIVFEREELESSEIKTGSDIVKGKLLGTRTHKWKTYTKVHTYRDEGWGMRYVGSHKENMQTHARDYSTYEYIDYKVTYRLDHYRLYYKCSECGFSETRMDTTYTELDRQQVGTHTAEVGGEEYRLRW